MALRQEARQISGFRRSLDLAWIAALGGLALLAWAPVQMEDTWFYAATGRWVVDHHAIPRSDPFSWTMAGQPWQSNGWLWGVLLWAVWCVGGMAALAALKPLYVAGSGLAIRWSARALGAERGPAMAGALIGTIATFPFLVERPQLASFLAAPLALALAHRALHAERWWTWWLALAGLFALWANLHSVALMGVPLVGALAFGAVLDARSRTVGPWLRATGVTAAAAVGSLVNPWGISLWTHASEVRSVSRGQISEWEPLWRRGSGGVLALVIVVAVVALAIRYGGLRRLTLLAPLALSAVLAVDAIRAFPVFAVVAGTTAPALVPAVRPISMDRQRMLTLGSAALLFLGLVVAVPRITATGDPSSETPVASVDALPDGCRLLNDYAFGNWVMFHRPDLLVSDDGRNDLYGIDDPRGPFLTSSAAAEELAAWTGEHEVTCVLARPESPAVTALRAAGWQVVGADPAAVALTAP